MEEQKAPKLDGLPPLVQTNRPVEDTMPVFSKELEAVLAEVAPSDDPLDAVDFDPVQYINGVFPDEASLENGKLDTFIVSLRRQVSSLSEGLTKDVRDFSSSRTRTQVAVDQAQDAMAQLFGKIKAIKEKANHSELMVQEICRDIKQLDYAKKHLTTSIHSLRNLHMLVSAVDQLTMMAGEKKWRECASLLRAITDLQLAFAKYIQIPKIKALTAQVAKLNQQIKSEVLEEFKNLIPNSPSLTEPQTRDHLREACTCVDALEPEVKTELLSWLTKVLLQPYVLTFSPGQDGSNLEQTDRRYAWLARVLKAAAKEPDQVVIIMPGSKPVSLKDQEITNLANSIRVFPEEWHIPAILCQDFCQLTSKHFVAILKENPDIKNIIKALQRAIEFETELSVRFKALAPPVQPPTTTSPTAQPPATESKDAPAPAPAGLYFSFAGLISCKFFPYLSGFVDLERGNIKEMLDKIKYEEKWNQDAISDSKRYPSSDDIFGYFQKSIKNCTKMTRGEVLFKIYKEYQAGLATYAALLRSKLPAMPDLNNPMTPITTSLSATEIRTVCLICNTSEYCNETTPKLEERIQKEIEDPYKDKVSLAPSALEFSILCTQAAQCLATLVCTQLSKALNNMSKMPWATWDSVGDQSPYINEVNTTLMTYLPEIATLLSPAYHAAFCMQLATSFIPKYIEAIHRCKFPHPPKVSMGAQQLALDCHALKLLLLHVPEIGLATISTVHMEANDKEIIRHAKKAEKKRGRAGAYNNYVIKEMGNAEALLKTLVTGDNDRLIANFKALMPQASVEDLCKVFALRGLNKREQQALVDAYNAELGPGERISLGKAGISSNLRAFIPI